MHYFLDDLTGVVAATLLSLLLIVVPGFGLAEILTRAGIVGAKRTEQTCWGLILGPAVLPAIDALLLRWFGMASVLMVHVAVGAVGIRLTLATIRSVGSTWWAAFAGAWLLVAWANVDFDWAARLYQSVTVIDGVKHATVISALANHGVPLRDPFFARDVSAGYYYYFYLGPALIRWLGVAFVDGRAAFAAGTFATMLAFPATIVLLANEAGLVTAGRRRRFAVVTVGLCCLSGLDLLPGLYLWATTGTMYAQLDWWSEEVRWALTSILWVPQHISAVIAVYAAAMLIADAERGQTMLRSILAGMIFATAFGCSLWIAVAAVPILLLWWAYERARSGSAGIWSLPLSGGVALALSALQIRDILLGRSSSGAPLGFYVRPLGPLKEQPGSFGEALVHLAVAPGGYLIEFGVFAIGAILFLRRGGLDATRSTPIGRLLLVGAPVALLLVTFVHSTVIYNDFGWRSVWFAQVPTLVWTAALLSGRDYHLQRSWPLSAAMVLGAAATVWDVTGLRLIRPYYSSPYVNARPEIDYDERGAYAWIDHELPANAVVQHNPTRASRAFDFGLYGDRQVAVADSEARLFGADEQAVESRIALVSPMFEGPMPAADLRRRSAAAGISALVLTSADPLWISHGGPPRDWTCQYRSVHSCVMLLGKAQS